MILLTINMLSFFFKHAEYRFQMNSVMNMSQINFSTCKLCKAKCTTDKNSNTLNEYGIQK